MDITAGAGRNGAQEIPRHDHVCRRAADAMGRFRGDAAWTVGTETASDTLKPEAAFDGLALHPGGMSPLEVLLCILPVVYLRFCRLCSCNNCSW